MTIKLVLENLKHRPIRTLLSALAIGVQVTMILTLVGVSEGMLDDQRNRTNGVGADIAVRPPGSAAIGLTGNMPDKLLPFLAKQPHVAQATPILVEPTGPLTSITGLDFPSFSRMSGSFRFLEGGPIQHPNEVIVDEFYAHEHKLAPGSRLKILGQEWRVAGVFEQGKLARLVVPLDVLQNRTANTGKISAVYLKLDDPARTDEVIEQFKHGGLADYQIISMAALLSQMSVNNIPVLKNFIAVVIALGVIVGFLVVFLSMYTAVLERTREIGVLKALGASPAFILRVLLLEATLITIIGWIMGIAFSYGTRILIASLVPGSFTQAIVPGWWPRAGAIALGGALLGAIYPGLKAAKQDAIEALAFD